MNKLFAEYINFICSLPKISNKVLLSFFCYTFFLFQNLKENAKQVYIFHLILVTIPSDLILSVKNRVGGVFLLNKQNLLSMMKVRYLLAVPKWLTC